MQALARPDEALAEMHRVLKPGGEVWVDALNARCLPTAWREYRRQRAGAPPHLRYDHPDEFLEAARVAGLEPCTCTGCRCCQRGWHRCRGSLNGPAPDG